MNELGDIDCELLKRLKKKIELRSGLTQNCELNQKDFDFLLFFIHEKTGQTLSLTTVKRIWRNEYSRLPHLSTLDMLSHLAEGKDWHTLKKEVLEAQAPHQPIAAKLPDSSVMHLPVEKAVTASPEELPRSNFKILFSVGAAALLVLFLGTCRLYILPTETVEVNTAQFSAVTTADGQIPTSVVFSYDVSAVKADRFYIQQTWDTVRKVEISAKNNKQTDIYYEPGYHYAKLLANNQIIKEIPVHIKYKDWYVRFRYPDSKLVKVSTADVQTQGYLGLKREFLSTHFRPLHDEFQLGYMLSKDFNIPADEFGIEALVQFDSLNMPMCPMIHLLIKGDRDYAWITIGNIGCESNLGLKVGNSYMNGKTNDLSLLGTDVFSWQKIGVKLSQGTYRISINNQLVQEGSYSNALGELKEIDFFFNGIGSIDEINFEDQQQHALPSQYF